MMQFSSNFSPELSKLVSASSSNCVCVSGTSLTCNMLAHNVLLFHFHSVCGRNGLSATGNGVEIARASPSQSSDRARNRLSRPVEINLKLPIKDCSSRCGCFLLNLKYKIAPRIKRRRKETRRKETF